MKAFITMLVLLLTAVAAPAQNPIIKKEPVANAMLDSQGNYVAVSHARTSAEPTKTKQTYTDSKGKVYPVWLSASGKPFVIRVSSKTQKEYRYYLKTDTPQVGKPLIQ